MKIINNILTVILFTLFTFSCKNEVQPEVKTVSTEVESEELATLDPDAHYAKAEFNIEGMTCAMGCARTIEKKISGMAGVKSATVNFDKQLAMVEYDEAKVTPVSLEEAVKNAGEAYVVKDMKTVTEFSVAHTCQPNCQLACCADNANSENKEKMAMNCAEDCKKACCVKKEKA